jgi:hypothetical protein
MTNVRANLPKSVIVGGQRIRLDVSTSLEDWGQYNHDTKAITISHRALERDSTLRTTLRHELMHAALSISGVSYCTGFQEEAVVRCMEEVFFPSWEKLHTKLTNTKKP